MDLKFEKLWELMSFYNFEVDTCGDKGIICTICSKLLIEPYSSICGCHFCGTCIKKFSSIGGKFCPGKSVECGKTVLELDKNVLIDFTTNFVIAKIVVKCPYPQCSYRLQLEKMEEHIRYCSMRPMVCPYQCIGCADGSALNVKEHLDLEIHAHSQLLVEAFNNLKNDCNAEVESTAKIMKDHKAEIEQLKSENESNKSEVTELRQIISANEALVENLLKKIENIKKTEKVPQNEKEKWRKIDEKNSLELEKIRKEFLTFKNAVENFQQRGSLDEDDKMKLEITHISSQLEAIRKDVENFKGCFEKLPKKDFIERESKKNDKEMSSLKAENKRIVETLKDADIHLKELTLKADNDFIWKVNNFSKNKITLQSDSFLKYYYKFNLTLISDGTKMILNLHIIKGELDDHIEWPMKHMFILGIVNQNNMSIYKCEKYSYTKTTGDKGGFHQPSSDRNKPIGGFCVSVNNIHTISGLMVKNSILVLCSVRGQ